MSQQACKWAIVVALIGLLSMLLSGCGCALLEVLDSITNFADDFCSSEIGESMGKLEVRKSASTMAEVGSKAKDVYNKACDAAPIVSDISGYLGSTSGCKDVHTQVYVTCKKEFYNMNSDVTTSGSGWNSLFGSEMAKTIGVELGKEEQLLSDDGFKLSTVSLTAKPKATPIEGSNNWWSCSHPGMHTCSPFCCCNAGFSYDGDSACKPSPPAQTCPFGMLYSASSIERTGDAIGKAVEVKGQILDVLSVGEVSQVEMDKYLKKMSSHCPSNSPLSLYALYDDKHTDKVYQCWVNLVTSEKWSSST